MNQITRQRDFLVEVCAASLDDVMAANRSGADRIELNAAVSLGGLTPSAGLLRETVSVSELPVVTMCRPRPSGFCYTAGEYRTLLADCEAGLAGGATGIAFGVLQTDRRIDQRRCRDIVARADGQETVFHRALDLTPDLVEAVACLVDCGVTRVMTSGGQATAAEGTARLADLVARFGDQIEIMAAGGIRPANRDAVLECGIRQIHAGPGTWAEDPSQPPEGPVRFDAAPAAAPHHYRVVCEETLRQLVRAPLSLDNPS